jgi:ribonuclease HI
MAYAMSYQELDHHFVEITPEDWRHTKDIRVEFVFERPDLDKLTEVNPQGVRTAFLPILPVSVETDSACAGNCEKKSAGGWGAAIVQRNRICKLWGAKNDTSNNEMEYQAMLSDLEVIPAGAYVCFETDSQGCIDGLTKHRRRWEKHRWHDDDEKLVENEELISQVATQCDRRIVGFRKIKGHSHDPWNDLSGALAVKGRNQAATNVVIQLIFRAVIDRKEQFVGFSRFAVSSQANIYDFWPGLVEKCGDVIGEPEDYEIWQDRRKLEGPLIMGLEYEIIAKTAPGRTRPADASRPKRRSSIDFGNPSQP